VGVACFVYLGFFALASKKILAKRGINYEELGEEQSG
jgi:hypothetical protein